MAAGFWRWSNWRHLVDWILRTVSNRNWFHESLVPLLHKLPYVRYASETARRPSTSCYICGSINSDSKNVIETRVLSFQKCRRDPSTRITQETAVICGVFLMKHASTSLRAFIVSKQLAACSNLTSKWISTIGPARTDWRSCNKMGPKHIAWTKHFHIVEC